MINLPRAKIPYDELDRFVKDTYKFPAFKWVGIKNNHLYHTPKRIYHRKDGKYVPYGWKVYITGFMFTGIDSEMEAQYEYFFSTIVVEEDVIKQ